jgi:tRNA A-37 threonylcarbamoyl transferase component Bud32
MTAARPDLSDSLVLDLEVDALCSRFEQSWQRGERPSLDTQLPAGGPLRLKALAELVRLDLEYRLKAGEAVRVDTYLSRYPELQADPDRAAQLRSDEQRCRSSAGTETTFAEVLRQAPVCLEQTSVLGTGRDTVARTSGVLSPSVGQVGFQVDPRAASSAVSALLAPPQEPGEIGRLGNYRVLEVLGEGGMGMVLRAVDPTLHREVALKVMKPSIAADDSARERFLREARAAARLEHERIVAIYQVDEAPVGASKVLFLAMPLLRGESLESLLQRQPRLPCAELLRIAREIAEGLAVAHAAGLVHRDIKPANIWLRAAAPGEPGASTTGGRVQILDFGLARAERYEGELTQAGQVLGTPAYMAPEQAEGQPVDGRCDLFSLGCVLYRMTTGLLPFPGKNVMSILRSLATQNPKPPSQLDPAIPVALSELVMRLLAKDPGQRPASAREVVEALRALECSQPSGIFGAETASLPGVGIRTGKIPQRTDTGVMVPEGLPDLRPAKPARSRGLLIGVSVGVVGLVAVGVAAWALLSGGDRNSSDAATVQHPGLTATQRLGKDPLDPTKEEPLTGKMAVRIWSDPPDRKKGLVISRERNGAVPVCEDEMIMVEVAMNKPAYLYLVWVDGKGLVTPLYPWNRNVLDIQDIAVPPPQQQPQHLLRNPPRDRSGWVLDNTPGLDTILLLANPTPLPANVSLADLIGRLPAAPLGPSTEVIVNAFDRGKRVDDLTWGQDRAPKKEAKQIDDQLQALVDRLKDRFEVIRAIQFAHVPKEKRALFPPLRGSRGSD